MARTLRDEIEEAIGKVLFEKLGHSTSYVATAAGGAVWELLEDRIGSVQEKLMTDLHNARTELRLMTAERNALADHVKELMKDNEQ